MPKAPPEPEPSTTKMKTCKRKNKKIKKNIIDENAINSATLEVTEGRLSISKAAAKYKLKRTTLHYRIAKRRFESDNPQTKYSTKLNSQQVFTVSQEKQLLEYLVKYEKVFYGLTLVQLQQLAYKFAKKIECRYPRRWNDTKSGDKTWVIEFCNRNKNISLKEPEDILFNKTNLSKFYKNLEEILKKYNFTADRIVNFDDVNIDEHDLIINMKNNQDHQTVSTEKRNYVIFGGIIIGNGDTIPPIFVFPPVLKHIQKHTNCTKEKPVLLLCVSHESHVSIEAMDYSLESGIIYLSFPPCTSHMLQPLHAIFDPFKTKLKIAFDNWYKNDPKEILPIHKTPALGKIAYSESFTYENITSAFSKSGIWPFSKVFSVEDFPFYKESRDVPNKDFQASTSKVISDATSIPTDQTQSFVERQKSEKSRIYTDSLENKEQNFSNNRKSRPIKEQGQRAKELEKPKKLSGCSKQIKKNRNRWEIDSDWTSEDMHDYSSNVTNDTSTEFSDDDNSINNMITPVQSEPENPKVSNSVLIKYEEDIDDDEIEQDTTMNNGILQESGRDGMESDMSSLPHNSQNDSSILNTSTNSTSMQIRSSESNNDNIKDINGTYSDPSLVTLNNFLQNHPANQLSHSTNQNGLNSTTLTPEQSFGLLDATELKRIPEPEKKRTTRNKKKTGNKNIQPINNSLSHQKNAKEKLSSEEEEILLLEVQCREPLWNFKLPFVQRNSKITKALWEEAN